MLDLRDGTALVLRVRQDADGFTISVGKEVGNRTKVLSTKRVKTAADMWLAIARWGDQRLAQVGLEQAEKETKIRNPRPAETVSSGEGS